MNQKTNASAGEKAFYEKIKTGEVRAIRGNSDKGDGWRPVCRGHYLGSACVDTESEAITKGKIFIGELKKRVEGVQPSATKRQPSPKRDRKTKAVSK